MLSVAGSSRIFVAGDAVDFRKQFDGLAAIAREQFDMDPCSGHVFVFFNKRRDRIKILVFEHTGFWLHYKRLERGTFETLIDPEGTHECVEVEARTLRMLLDGLDLRRAKFRRHFADSMRVERGGAKWYGAGNYADTGGRCARCASLGTSTSIQPWEPR